MTIRYEETKYGFIYGAATVERLASNSTGKVVVGITTPKRLVQVYVTKTGKVRVFDHAGNEWTPPGGKP